MKKKDTNQSSSQLAEDTIISKQGTPYVFISHDTRDAELAEEFSNLIRKVSAGMLQSFRSSDKKGDQGIEFGREWYPELIKKLNQATDIIGLLTTNSINRPWILFETGIAKGNKNNLPVIGIALGITLEKAVTGPFAQFQNLVDDEDSLLKLVLQLCTRIPDLNPDKEIASNLVKDFIKKKDEILSKKPQTNKEEVKVESIIIKLFEELKLMNQDLIYKIGDRLEPELRKKTIRFHPKYFHELMHFSKEIDSHNIFLIMISIFKNDFPWIYEVGLETYKILKTSKSEKEIRNSIREFERLIEFSFHSPFSREMIRFEKDIFFIIEEFHFVLTEFAENLIEKRSFQKKLKSNNEQQL